MQKIKQNDKNTVKELNDNYLFTPNVSIGVFKFNDEITKYKDYYHTYFPQDEIGGSESYYFFYPPIIVFIDEERISSITCDDFLIWKGKNIVGMLLKDFILLNDNKNFDTKERLYVLREEYKTMVVYDFDDIGLQLWTFRNKIIFTACHSNLDF